MEIETLPLPNGSFALIDSDDFERAGKFRWFLNDQGYVIRTFRSNGKKCHERLSRLVMNAPDGVYVDHIHGNRLDNRKSELRFATHAQNLWNRGKNKNNKSGFKGVSWNKRESKWRAQIMVNRKWKNLGDFVDIHEAAEAYAEASLRYHGEFGRTKNFA